MAKSQNLKIAIKLDLPRSKKTKEAHPHMSSSEPPPSNNVPDSRTRGFYGSIAFPLFQSSGTSGSPHVHHYHFHAGIRGDTPDFGTFPQNCCSCGRETSTSPQWSINDSSSGVGEGSSGSVNLGMQTETGAPVVVPTFNEQRRQSQDASGMKEPNAVPTET
ncbi:hypothetical protein PG987_011586 [Apiospora arundinis]